MRTALFALITVFSLTVSLALAVSSALATQSAPSTAAGALSRASVPGASQAGFASPYGQVTRFGGFGDTPGKFVLPVGFAVDPQDSNAVYVLDRTTATANEGGGELGYRLQKISSTGSHEVLGTATLPVEHYTAPNYTGAHPLISLTVDSAKHRVYALVENIVESGESEGVSAFVPVAQRLVAWSTQPNAKKELVAAAGYSQDPVTDAGLVAELSDAEAGKDLYAPAGLSVNHSHEVVVEAQQGVEPAAKGGPTVLQPVIAEGSKQGQLGTSWVANTTIAPSNEQADGVFTATNGSLGIDLYEAEGKISRLASVKPNFATPEASLIAPDTSEGVDLDQAPTIDNRFTVNYNTNTEGQSSSELILEPYTAGSPITQLSNTLYAARFAKAGGETIDSQSQVEPWNGLPDFWFQSSAKSVANEGIRLFTANGTVITTIGGQPQGQACNLDSARLAVAAGASGSVFALTQPNEENGNTDDEVIEFAPGGKGACPQPSGSLTVNGQSGSSFSFPVGTDVTLADAVERKGEAPYRFDWVLYGGSGGSFEDLKTQIEGPEYKWPAPITSHTFTKAGTYYVTATVYGDYGLTYIATDKIRIH